MKCVHCETNIRMRDIDNSIFRMISGNLIGTVKCRNRLCNSEITIKQVTVFVPVLTPLRRKDDQLENVK